MEEKSSTWTCSNGFKPREVVQMDTIDFGDLFAFTGVDNLFPGGRRVLWLQHSLLPTGINSYSNMKRRFPWSFVRFFKRMAARSLKKIQIPRS